MRTLGSESGESGMAPDEDLHAHVRAIESELNLGITAGFLEGLMKEPDDWSFIIKLQALIEAAVTHLITVEINREPLQEVFARMEMGDGHQRGKLFIAKQLDLFDAEVIGFFRTIGQIRNRFAHNVTDVSRSGSRRSYCRVFSADAGR